MHYSYMYMYVDMCVYFSILQTFMHIRQSVLLFSPIIYFIYFANTELM